MIHHINRRLQNVWHNETLKKGDQMSKRACQTISPYNMYRINQLVLSIQPIYRTHTVTYSGYIQNNILVVHTRTGDNRTIATRAAHPNTTLLKLFKILSLPRSTAHLQQLFMYCTDYAFCIGMRKRNLMSHTSYRTRTILPSPRAK